VGGTKGFSLEKIDALSPDLIIANKEENRRHQIDELRKKYPVFVTYPRTVAEAMQMIIDLGTLTGTSQRGADMAESCGDLLASIPRSIMEPQFRTACMIWRDPWMAVGPDTYVNDLLEMFGFRNVFSDSSERYPKTPLQSVLDLTPDVVILPSEPYEFGKSDRLEVRQAVRDRRLQARILLADGSHLTWFGVRTLRGFEHLRDLKRQLVETPS
jgi:ABC-type Fe3+-hydroxamate transport system substrate-binding protein